MFFTVRDKFDPGELVEKPDTLYAVPVDWTIESFRDASGGGGDFQYIWRMERSVWNPETGEWDPVPDDTREPLYKGAEIVKTASFDYTFTQPGKYTFTRKVSEQSCETTPMESLRPHIVVVYEQLNGGEIESFTRELCSPF
jgi:hypothetical protein